MIDNEALVAAYEQAVEAGYVRLGERARGSAAALVAAQACGLVSSTPVLEALRAERHPDALAWDAQRSTSSQTANPRGRPRKDGARTEAGRLSRAKDARRAAGAAVAEAAEQRELERADRRQARPAELARMRDFLRDKAMDHAGAAAWLTPAGMDFLAGRITDNLFAEAISIFEARADLVAALGMRAVRSVDLEPELGRSDVDPDSEAGEREAARQRDDLERWRNWLAAIDVAALRLCETTPRAYGVTATARGSVLRYCVEGSASDEDRARARLVLAAIIDGRRAAERASRRRRA